MEEDTDKDKTGNKVTRRSEDELSDEELSNVTGGAGPTETISFP